MNKLRAALNNDKLKELDIHTWQEISKGINSKIYKLTDSNDTSYALKMYKPATNLDWRNRLQTETNFLEYIHKSKAACRVPQLIISNPENNWNLLSWINGNPLDQIRREDVVQIAKFISDINAQSIKTEDKTKLQKASEACTGSKSIKVHIELRMEKLIEFEPNTML